MSTEIELFNVLLLVAISLIFARGFGYLFYKLKQPAVLGEIIAGITIGGFLVLLSGTTIDLLFFQINFDYNFQSAEFDILNVLAEIGILFLLFISGLQISVSRIKKMGKTSSAVAIGGVIAPLVLGILGGILIGLSIDHSIVIGLILTATSVGVTVRTLMDLNVLDTDVGTTILGSAVIDDVLAIILLAFALGVHGSLINVAIVGIKIAIFFLIFLLLGLKIIDKILDLGEKIHLPKAFLSITLAILLIYSYFADKAEISGIIGAFIAGLLIGQSVKSRKIEEDIKTIGYGFFIPLFFVWVGINLWGGTENGFPPFFETLTIIIVVLIIAIIGKIFGSAIGARISGMNLKQSLQIGVGMLPRMELALIIVTAAISRNVIEGVIAQQLLITTIILTIVTTMITPIFIKVLFKNE